MASSCMLTTTGSWKFLLTLGIIGLLIGGIFFFFPDLSLRLVIYLFAGIALLAGIILLAASAAIARGDGGFFAVPLVLGVLAVILAAYSFLNPESIAAVLAIVIGIGCIIAGLTGLFHALFQQGTPIRRVLLAAGGIVLAGVGVVIIVYLQRSVLVIFQLLGAFLLLCGAIAFVGAVVMWLRRDPCEPGVIDAEFREE